MKYIICTLLLTLIVSISIHAQQDPQYTHNSFDRLSVNPAAAGISGQYCVSTILRNQWMGFDGAPKTGLLNLQAPFEIAHGGLGLTFFQDKLGFENNSLIRLSYSYHIKLPNDAKLGIGIAGGTYTKRLDPEWRPISWADPTLHAVPLKNTTMNLAAGFYYSRPGTMYLGISSTNMNQGSFENLSIQSMRHYYIQGGYSWQATGPITILPSFLIKSDVASTQIDLNTIAVWDSRFYVGLTYRHQDALAVLAGVVKETSPTSSLKVGMSYDITTSALTNTTSGGVELMVKFCFTIPPDEGRYRDVRNMGTSPFLLH
jgi:type IX secretion system PorP/SprF family membrane protein